MKHQVSTLSGALLDAAVAKALGWEVTRDPEDQGGGLSALDVASQRGHLLHDEDETAWSPSRLWEDGGPVLERDRLERWELEQIRGGGEFEWAAMLVGSTGEMAFAEGPTMLVALMRAFVLRHLGDEVDLP